MEKCPECSIDMIQGFFTGRRDFGESRYEASIPTICCPSCGNSVLSADDWELLEMSIAKAVVLSNERGRAAFRYCRQALGIGREEMGHFFRTNVNEVSFQIQLGNSSDVPVPPEWWEILATAVMSWEPPYGKTLPDCTITRI